MGRRSGDAKQLLPRRGSLAAPANCVTEDLLTKRARLTRQYWLRSKENERSRLNGGASCCFRTLGNINPPPSYAALEPRDRRTGDGPGDALGKRIQQRDDRPRSGGEAEEET